MFRNRTLSFFYLIIMATLIFTCLFLGTNSSIDYHSHSLNYNNYGNPCPCGFFGDTAKACTCNPGAITRYQKRISGPILDRIDIHVAVPAVKVEKLTHQIKSEPSNKIQIRVQKARDIQIKRFKSHTITSNAEMGSKLTKQFCNLDKESILLLKQAIQKLNLSARSFNRVVKIARTIADLENSLKIKSNHVAEALQYRPSDI